jgi:integrase
MALRRQRVNRTTTANMRDGLLIELPLDWRLHIDCQFHGPMIFDFEPFTLHGRVQLASQFRDALWSLRHESSGASLATYHSGLQRFWRFLDDYAASNPPITRLDQVDRACLDSYLTWLELQTVPVGQKNAGSTLLVSTKRSSFTSLKTLLINRQKRDPASVSAQLTFMRNPYPNANRLMPNRQPYSTEEHRRILNALNEDLREIHIEGDAVIASLQVLVVKLLVLACATGANLQPLLELTRDSVREHPLKDRELLITEKRRGWKASASSISKSSNLTGEQEKIHTIPTSIGDHFRALCRFTEPLVPRADERSKPYIFLWAVSRGTRKDLVIRLTRLEVKTGIRDFARRHALKDDSGKLLSLSFSRIRPTFATELYRRTSDIRLVSQALGHSSVQTTARSYARSSPEAERNHALVADSMSKQFTKIDFEGKILLAADGSIPLANVGSLLTNGYNTGIARCQNPFREEDSVCKKFFSCFRCPDLLPEISTAIM